MKRQCKNCFYFGECNSYTVCEYYTSSEEYIDDKKIDRFIEKERIAFRKEWFQYLEENDA